MPSSISSGSICLVSTYSDNSRLQLAPSIKCLTLWCQATSLLLPVPQVGNMTASRQIPHFCSHPAAFVFQATLPPDSITLIFLIFTLALVQWLMSFSTQSILFSYIYLSTSFWSVLCVNRFVIQHVF